MIGDEEPFDVLVVGAGASGLGVGVALKHAGITNFQILDRGRPAQSFMDWPSGLAFPMTSAQTLTAVYLAGVLLPCLVTALTIAKESSWKQTSVLLARQAAYAILFSLVLAWGGRYFL